MDIQEAIDAPRFRSKNFPDSFSPHDSEPGVLELEASLFDSIAEDLKGLGYEVRRWPDWDNHFSAVGAVLREPGGLVAGSDPREATAAMALSKRSNSSSTASRSTKCSGIRNPSLSITSASPMAIPGETAIPSSICIV